MTDIKKNTGDGCIICCNPIKIYAYGKCLHTICYKCSLRMRVLCKENYCPVCRTELPKIIYSSTFLPSEVEYLERNVGDQIPEWGIYFNSKEIHDISMELLQNPCIFCPKDSFNKHLTFKALENHLKLNHGRYFCDLCVEHLKIFTIERSVYTLEELATHHRCGDSNMGDKSHKGHPLCEFCNKRYLDSECLYKHLRREHYFCHFCEADGLNQYYSDYPVLRDHFRTHHFLCEEGDCQQERFVTAFRTEIDFKNHKLEKHSHGLDRASQRLLRSVDISFNYAPRNQREYMTQNNNRRDNSERVSNRGQREGDEGQRYDRRPRRFESGTFRPDERSSHNSIQNEPFPQHPSQMASKDRANVARHNTFSQPEFYHGGASTDFNQGAGWDENPDWAQTPKFKPEVDFPTLKPGVPSHFGNSSNNTTVLEGGVSSSAQVNSAESFNGNNGLFLPKPFTDAVGQHGARPGSSGYPTLPTKSNSKLSFKSQFGINAVDKRVLEESFPALAPSTTRPASALSARPTNSQAKTSLWTVPVSSKMGKKSKQPGISGSQETLSQQTSTAKPGTPPGFTRISSKTTVKNVVSSDEFPSLSVKPSPRLAAPPKHSSSMPAKFGKTAVGPSTKKGDKKSVTFNSNATTKSKSYFTYEDDELDDHYYTDGVEAVNEFHLCKPLDKLQLDSLVKDSNALAQPLKPNVIIKTATAQTLPRPYVQPPSSDEHSYPSLGKKGTTVIGKTTLNPKLSGRDNQKTPSPLDQLIARLNGGAPTTSKTISKLPKPIKATGLEVITNSSNGLKIPFASALEKSKCKEEHPPPPINAYSENALQPNFAPPDLANAGDFPLL